MSKRYLAALLPLLSAAAFAPTANATPPHAPLPGCTTSIGAHLATGCYMRGTWYGGGAGGIPSKEPLVVTRRQAATARAIVPLDASTEGSRLTYAVKFNARMERGQGLFDNNLTVKVWLADDKNQHAMALREVQLSVDRHGMGYITVEAPGRKTGYQPHYVYVSFAALGNAYADPAIDNGAAIRIKDVEFSIYPTQS
ncbi:hypothetical protein [Luteibacter aegosomatissinici]|uniref:hypothetical protein n=1 Tax=Luteibacter aegosomatissinici TaxID=2911539 RepID=UPI001FFC16BD|nr:hypothetical protein [Luteibacter aegosomatissinici]UPG95623.1 hypothetical protein L2Y97_05795 [Luteibacter aegosomatissinici]